MRLAHRFWLSALSILNVANAIEPCAELSQLSRKNNMIPPSLALRCLRSVPVQAESVRDQLEGLKVIATVQSDLAYLKNTTPARLYPATDLLEGLHILQKRLEDEYYSNEYDLQLDVYRLMRSAYDGHLDYTPDIVNAFIYMRVMPSGHQGVPNLISVSADGIELPKVYSYLDVEALANSDAKDSYTPSPVSKINGRDVGDFIVEQAALNGRAQDPDANVNMVLRRATSAPDATLFELFPIPPETDKTVLVHANGTTTSFPHRAYPRVGSVWRTKSFTDGQSFFQACCSKDNATWDDLLERSSSWDGTANMMLPHPFSMHSAELSQSHMLLAKPVFSLGAKVLAGYFPNSAPDLAVLTIGTFMVDDPKFSGRISDFQKAIGKFLLTAKKHNKSRLIIDLRGNRGGWLLLADDTFRQIFPSTYPYWASNCRANRFFGFLGTVFSRIYSGLDASRFGHGNRKPPFFDGITPFNYRESLDADDLTFKSWPALFGPTDANNIDAFTNLIRYNASDSLVAPCPVYPDGRTAKELSRPQVFSPENIILLQDGSCASGCATFTEMMKTSAPTNGTGRVRQVVVGGRAQTGPQQGVGATKGGQVVEVWSVGHALAVAAEHAPRDIKKQYSETLMTSLLDQVLEMLNRGSISRDRVSLRNSIRRGDHSATPLQHVYDAADYRIFHTAEMYLSQEEIWRKAYEVSWEDGRCVEGSTGHPSAAFVTDYADIQIPKNARSPYGIKMS